MGYKGLNVPPEFLISKANIHRSPSDVPVGLWPLYYQEIANWITNFDHALFYEDPFTARKCFSILFGLVQPSIQTKKDKWKDPESGREMEAKRIMWYQKEIGDINDKINSISPYISRVPGQLGYSINKTDQGAMIIKTIHEILQKITVLQWKLMFDMYSVGLTFPRGEDPSMALMKSQ